jgi:hypothetical protein
MIGHSAAVLCAFATVAAAGGAEVSSMTHRQLAVGQQFEIATDNQVFRGHLLDRATGECQLAVSDDGASFSPARTMYLLGATAGPQDRQMLVLMHVVKVGMKMELGVNGLEQKNRLVTGEVKAIKLWR